jgi:hypothetical protein
MPSPRHDFNLYQCNPSTLKDTKTTCLPMDMLERLRAKWNEQFPKHKIPASIRRKETLWAELRKRMQNQYKCASEYCAVQELGDAADKQSTAQYFRPKKPTVWEKDPDDWHDTLTIAKVMEQYEPAFPDFEFIGPVPIDFDTKMPGGWGRCVVDELCNIDLRKLKSQGTRSVGIVFNLDPHDRPGSHWVCAYINLIKCEAYYYDSYGYEPCAEIRRLLRRCREQGCDRIMWNDVRHQRKESECGTYCMYVLISLLKGRSFTDICKERVPDDVMNAFRDILYATERPREAAIKEVTKLLRLG